MTVVTFSHRNLVILMVGAAAACARAPRVAVSPAPDAPEATIEQFLAAVADTNLGRMAELWGTERGPSTVTNRSSQQVQTQILTIMQRLLQSDEHRVIGSATSQNRPNQRVLQVELERRGRRFVVPFTMVATRTGGWLVLQVGLDAAMPAPAGRTSP